MTAVTPQRDTTPQVYADGQRLTPTDRVEPLTDAELDRLSRIGDRAIEFAILDALQTNPDLFALMRAVEE